MVRLDPQHQGRFTLGVSRGALDAADTKREFFDQSDLCDLKQLHCFLSTILPAEIWAHHTEESL